MVAYLATMERSSSSKDEAVAVAKTHKRKLLEIDAAGVSGWLVLNKPL